MATLPKTVRLPRLPIGWQDQPQLLERYWDEAMTAIEKSLNAVLALPEIQESLASVDAAVVEAKAAAVQAQTAADNAGTAADGAQAQSDAQRKEASLNQSYVSGFTGSLITATALGNITIAAHTRVYGDPALNPSVSVAGGTLSTTATSDDVIRIFYSDPSRSGGVVTYQYTVDPDPVPVQSGDIHSVGAVSIPATGTRPGNGVRPPGYVEA